MTRYREFKFTNRKFEKNSDSECFSVASEKIYFAYLHKNINLDYPLFFINF